MVVRRRRNARAASDQAAILNAASMQSRYHQACTGFDITFSLANSTLRLAHGRPQLRPCRDHYKCKVSARGVPARPEVCHMLARRRAISGGLGAQVDTFT